METPTFEADVLAVRMTGEGGDGRPTVPIALCGEPMEIRYNERHLLDLQELFKAAAGRSAARGRA